MVNAKSTTLEIERRFLVAPPLPAGLVNGRLIVQGYLTVGTPSVRVRWTEGKYVLTIKGEREPNRPARLETEFDLPREAGEALFRAAGDRIVRKTRYVLDRWELDAYHQALAGLVVLEIELARDDEPLPTFPPGIRVLREITDDRRFDNSALAALTPLEQRVLVATL